MANLNKEKSIFINAPFEMVAGYATNLNNYTQWNPTTYSLKVVSGDGKPGTKSDSLLSTMGLNIPIKGEITELNVTSDSAVFATKFSFTVPVEPDAVYTGTYKLTITKKDGGTEVIYFNEYHEPFNNVLANEMHGNTMEYCLKNLKLLLESQQCN